MFAQGKLLWHIVADYSVQAMKSEAALQNTFAITINIVVEGKFITLTHKTGDYT